MRYSSRLAIIFLLLIYSLNISSQSLSSIKAVGFPDIFNIPVPDIEKTTSFTSWNKYWIVYSDRENNNSYVTPGGSSVKNTLNFMERFRVAENNGEYVHIYKESMSTVWPQISSAAVDYGWISKDKLLLWEHCYRNASSLIDKKAMVLNTFEGITTLLRDNQVITYKKDPELKILSDKKARLFEILFVYKFTKTAVLLGENMQIQGNETDVLSSIRGWVPIESVTFWDHRITLEPNWEPEAAKERSDRGIKPSVFLDEKAATDYKKGSKVDSRYIVWENEPGAKRNIGQWRRFPILGARTTGIYRTGVMGKITTSTGDLISIERMADIRNSIAALENKARKINVVFVVDGTESMGKFYSSIAKGIETSVENLRREDSQNRFSFGAVIYRDFLENENRIELKQMTENYKEITEFFNVARTDYSQDNDMPEAVYYGLKTALTQLGLKPGESNFIVLIGDCGNHDRQDDTQVPIEEIIDLLAQYECSLISYQVNNGYNPAYQDFIDQSRRVVIGSSIKNRAVREEMKLKWITENSGLEAPYFLSTGPNRYSLNPQEIVGSYLFPGIGQSLPYEILEKEIVDKIDEFDTRISQMLSKANLVFRGGGMAEADTTGATDEFHPAVVDFLSKMKDLSDGEIELLKNKNFQFSMNGYTAKNVSDLKYPIFKESLFMSRDDLNGMISLLNTLCDRTGTMTERRQRMQNNWIEILESILGSKKREAILDMSSNDLNNVVFGLPSQSQFNANVKLRDIVEPTVITDTQFEQYAQYLCNKLMGLKAISNDQKYRESFVSNNIVYYWIPMEIFP